ncbi:medium-chain-fatty-acid-CoA ligase [Pseudooceanicola batsensis HTCC2597]|uniref:3-methylmercaptopropionyl-CoA ligase n=1 Tax=Pseudooceanicola batsensis (strain ATCC BAA-863 / DSM 15984 / KCTC 12145 / HTCC2597) TaxID=252305 RepID=A3U151_PSEBH|nr:long-chain fatty acid--CoA ligase [Pseudooceanicola batsensis]EAQ02034.1 medium-chain-fatty-acid-CoA ligase [Pseudooceanicola batsensis HTCC2597]
MLGLMQDRPLLISGLLRHAEQYHPDVAIVSKTCEKTTERLTYKSLAERARQLAQALIRLGVKPGDRVATMAWNTHRHLELYFAVSGIGAVLHTVNPRLFPEQIDYILNHAESSVLLFDITFGEQVRALMPNLTSVRHVIAMTDADHMAGQPSEALVYEDLIAQEDGDFDWPVFDENSASSLCYTSGTTGNPKGVLYSHRSTVLHSFVVCQRDGLNLGAADCTLLAVPLFHVNAWGVPYASAMCGARLVLPGPDLDGKSLYDLAVAEGCTFSLGVPTVWLGLFKHIEETGADTSKLTFDRVVIGGSAAPRSIIEKFRRIGVFVIHAWGMSETSPLASVGALLPKHAALDETAQVDIQTLQGRAIFGVELRVVDDRGEPLPHDGKVAGDLQVRGPWIAAGYYKGEGGDVLDAEGWFSTGDVAKLDRDGYVQITDRSKDVIKSGGEWISSIDLENAAMAHPAVQEAAVIGIPHPKWQERPLLLVVRKAGASVEKSGLIDHLSGLVAKWWLPDDVLFVDELPHTATGKLQKMELRKRFGDHVAGS